MKSKLAEAQVETLRCVLNSAWVRSWEVAIDGGAGLGDWTVVMARAFGAVVAFEPCMQTFDKMKRRVLDEGHDNVLFHQKALLHAESEVEIIDPSGCGDATACHVREAPLGQVKAIAVDSLNLPACSLIKLDLEGAEPLALIGAKKTIARRKPVLIVEVSNHSSRFGFSCDEVHELIVSMGYHRVMEAGVDRVYIP